MNVNRAVVFTTAISIVIMMFANGPVTTIPLLNGVYYQAIAQTPPGVESQTTNNTGYSEYKGNRISFQYPTDWTISKFVIPGLENVPEIENIEISNNMIPAQIVVGSTPQGEEEDIVPANMTQKEIESHLDQIFPQLLKFVISQIQTCTLIELEKPVYDKYTVVEHKAGTAVWTTDCDGIPTTNMMVGTIVINRVAEAESLSIFYRAPEAVFNQNLPIVENVMNSIRFTANTTGAAEEGETTVAMPLGSSAAASGVGYDPPEITVSAGVTVVWDNQDNALHTATSGESPTPDGKFDTGMVGANQASMPVTMPAEPGEYTYFCTLHPFLVGTIIVQ